MDRETKVKIVKRTILLCWAALIACLVIKLFGGNYFDIVVENQNIINICNYIDGNFLKVIVRFVFLDLVFFLYCSAIMNKKMNLKQLAISTVVLLVVEGIKYCSAAFGFIADCLFLIGLPLIFSKWKIKNTIFGFILMNVFQIISLLTRNIGITILDAPTLIERILQIDYYIMLILYYLYSVKLKGEVK